MAHEDVNPLYIQWKNPEFLAFLAAQKGGTVAAGDSPLDDVNVMEYFSTSPFYDRRSNNEHVRMQSAVIHAQIAATVNSPAELLTAMAARHREELKCVRRAVRS